MMRLIPPFLIILLSCPAFAGPGPGKLTQSTFPRLRNTGFLDPSWTGTIMQAVPADPGELWILSQRDRFKVVGRLNSDGSMDPVFPPLELRDGLNYRIEPGTNGGFILTHIALNAIIMHSSRTIACCGNDTWRNRQRIQWFDAIGIQQEEVQIDLSSTGRPLFQAHPPHKAIFYNANTLIWQSQGTVGDPLPLSEVPIAAPNQRSDFSHWEIGTAHHFATEPGSGCLNLRLTQSEHRLFIRTHYSLP